jgi:hypothetical protein
MLDRICDDLPNLTFWEAFASLFIYIFLNLYRTTVTPEKAHLQQGLLASKWRSKKEVLNMT